MLEPPAKRPDEPDRLQRPLPFHPIRRLVVPAEQLVQALRLPDRLRQLPVRHSLTNPQKSVTVPGPVPSDGDALALGETLALALALVLSDALTLGDRLLDGDSDVDGLSDVLALGLIDVDGLSDVLALGLIDALADSEVLALDEGETLALGDRLVDGLVLALGDVEALGLSEVLALGETAALALLLALMAPNPVHSKQVYRLTAPATATRWACGPCATTVNVIRSTHANPSAECWILHSSEFSPSKSETCRYPTPPALEAAAPSTLVPSAPVFQLCVRVACSCRTRPSSARPVTVYVTFAFVRPASLPRTSYAWP